MSDSSGQTLAGYQLHEEIGRGGAAIVYRAFQPQLERWVAVKVLDIESAGGKQFLSRFRREARAIAALRHPNILNIYDYGEDQGRAYIVMEYVQGGSLTQRLGQPLPCVEALELLIPVADALAYSHTQGIVHRDIKPGNILLVRPDWPLLADFGLVKVLGSHQKLTQPGSILGTALYLSPEQVAGEEVNVQTDVYSLGVVLYELLTGKLPFQAATPPESMMLRLYEPPLPPRRLNPEIPAALETVLLRALERDLTARYPTMESLVNDLRRVLERSKRVSEPAAPQMPRTVQMITTRLGAAPTSVRGPQLFIATSGIALSIPYLDEVLIGRKDPLMPHPPELDLEPYGGGSAGVSRQHARFLHRPDGWFLEDLQSTNGTYVNEVRLLPQRPVRVRSGDLIRFAQLTLVFEEG